MRTRYSSLRAAAAQLASFVSFVARSFPSFYIVVALTLAVLILEYMATSLMIPLSSSAGGSSNSAVKAWSSLLQYISMPPTPKTWLWLFFVVMTARLSFGYLQIVGTTLLGKKVHRMLSGRVFGHIVSSEPLTAVYTRTVGHYITL